METADDRPSREAGTCSHDDTAKSSQPQHALLIAGPAGRRSAYSLTGSCVDVAAMCCKDGIREWSEGQSHKGEEREGGSGMG